MDYNLPIGITPAFDCFVQVELSDHYRIRSLATSNIALVWVDQDRYTDDGKLFLVPVAQGHTVTLTTSLTEDMVVTAAARDAPSPADLTLMSMSYLIREKEAGRRVVWPIVPVFVASRVKPPKALRISMDLDVQSITPSRPQGGDVAITITGRVLNTSRLGWTKGDATASEKREPPTGDPSPTGPVSPPAPGSGNVSFVSAAATSSRTVVIRYSDALDASVGDYTSLMFGSTEYTISALGGSGTDTHTLTIQQTIPRGQAGTVQVARLVRGADSLDARQIPVTARA